MLFKNKLLPSKIYHKRFSIKEYDFTHDGFFLYLDLDNLDEINNMKLFSLNRFNFFSIFYKDYGNGKFDHPKEYILNILQENKVDISKIDKIFLITMPRIFGYVFNPVSFWLCFNKKQDLVLSLAEVNNTFGERHSYICNKKNMERISSGDIIEKEKLFHVSPFFKIRGKYKFKFDISDEKIKIDINYFEENKVSLSTYIKGNIVAMRDIEFAKYIFLYPFLTLKVILLIHYHAFILWIKKIKFFTKPNKPKKDIS